MWVIIILSWLKIFSGDLMDVARQLFLLREGTVDQKVSAAHALGEMKCAVALPQLIRSLDDKDQHVRAASAWALGQIGDRSAILPLITAFEKYHLISRDDPIKLESKCLPAFVLSLQRLTGERFGFDVKRWQQYWSNNGVRPN
jgi:HEAT repeat protein